MTLDLKTYLDPAYQNSELRAYAYISSQFRRGARNSIDCLLPFVIFAIAQFEGEIFAAEKIKKFVNDRYFIDLPFFLIEDMRDRLQQAGALEYNSVSKTLICRDARPSGDGAVDEEMSEDLIDQVSRQLSAFAAARGVPEPLSGVSWSEVLLHFFSPTTGEREYKRNVIKDRAIIAAPVYVDNSIVAEFITLQHDTGSRLYEIVEKIYYGVLVTDFLTKIASSGSTQVQAGLEIVYDAPVLMRLLGFCGKLIKSAALEMHNTLIDVGCLTYYYSHSHTELLNNVEYIIAARRDGYPVKPETEEAFRKGELSISDLATFKASPDAILYNTLKITEHPASYEDRSGDQFQIDEAAFKAQLAGPGGRWGATSQAAENDAASLGLTMRLRKGKSYTDLWRSGTIFVTHNSGLVSKVRRYLKEEGLLAPRSLNPFQTMSQVTTVAWLASNANFEPGRVTSKLIADCYTAAVPDEGWNQELLNKVANYNADELQAMLNDVLFASSVRDIASRQTFGNTAILRGANAATLIRDAKADAERVKTEVRAEGVSEGREAFQLEIDAKTTLAAKRIADRIASIIALVVTLGCAAILVETGAGLDLPVVSKTNSFVVLCAAVLTVWSALQLFGFSRTFALSSALSKFIFPKIRRIQHHLIG